MANKLTEAKQATFLTNVTARIKQAVSAVSQVKQALLDTNANWSGYAAIEDAPADLQASGIQFATEVTAAWGEAKPDLETSLDVLAGGMGTTRNALLASMETETEIE